MTRQYIGARYVPKFSDVNGGVWSSAYTYGALEIVRHGNDYYTSKIPVPLGIDISNTTYWVLTGNYNGAIQSLQEQVDVLDGDMSVAQADILKREMTQISRTFLFMCDSYEVQIEYVELLADFIKCANYYKRAYTGAGFYKYDSAYNDYTFLNILQSIAPLSATEKANITDVAFCVACGNDNPQTDTDLSYAMRDIDTYLKSNLPNLKNIRLYAVGWASKDGTLQNKIRHNMTIYSRIASYLNWKYVDCTRVLKTGNYFNGTDSLGYHPDPNTARYPIAYAIASAIINGNCQYEICTPVAQNYDLTLPDAWSNASWTHPSDGILKGLVSIKNNGDIVFNQQDFPITIANASFANGIQTYDVELTPRTTNHVVLPVGYIMPMYGFINGSAILQSAAMIRTNANSTKIRCWIYSPGVSTGNVVLFTSPTVINI